MKYTTLCAITSIALLGTSSIVDSAEASECSIVTIEGPTKVRGAELQVWTINLAEKKFVKKGAPKKRDSLDYPLKLQDCGDDKFYVFKSISPPELVEKAYFYCRVTNGVQGGDPNVAGSPGSGVGNGAC